MTKPVETNRRPEPASPSTAGVEVEPWRISCPPDDFYGTGSDTLRFHPLSGSEIADGYTAEPLVPAASLDQATRRAEEAEADAAELRLRYENWHDISVRPESMHLHPNALLEFYMPGDETDENPATWRAETWFDRPGDAIAWCRIVSPRGPHADFFARASLSPASSITSKKETSNG